MEKRKLTQKFVESLKPRQKEYVVRDTVIPGYGVRVYPSGRKLFFVQSQNRGRRKQESLGTLAEMGEARARELAFACTAEGKAAAGEKHLEAALFEDVGAMFLDRYTGATGNRQLFSPAATPMRATFCLSSRACGLPPSTGT